MKKVTDILSERPIHKGESRFSCDFCKKRYRRVKMAYRHLEKVHGVVQ